MLGDRTSALRHDLSEREEALARGIRGGHAGHLGERRYDSMGKPLHRGGGLMRDWGDLGLIGRVRRVRNALRESGPKAMQLLAERFDGINISLIAQALVADQLRDAGMPARRADPQGAMQAATKMQALAALHNPDMVAGGKDAIGDFSDRQVHPSIAPQWKRRVGALDEAAAKVPASERSGTQLLARLERCG